MLLAALKELPISVLLTCFTLACTALPVKTTELTPGNFKEATSQGLWFIEHYSPHCVHCRKFAPTWEKLIEEARVQTPSVTLAQVNCALYGDLCDKNGVKGYPSMIMFKDGNIVDEFKGVRDLEDLHDFIGLFVKEPETIKEASIQPVQPKPILNQQGEVLILKPQSFSDKLEQGPAFVKFYAPWCGHCKKLAPIWKQLAKHMQNKITIAQVDCDEHKSFCGDQGIEGYPTLVFFSGGTRSEYNGGRKLEQLMAFSEKALAAGLQPLGKPTELDKHVSENDVVYLFINTNPDSQINSIVSEAAAPLLGSPPIYMTSSSELRDRFSIPASAQWAIVTLKDHDIEKPSTIFQGNSATTRDNLKNWLLSHRLPTTVELTQDSFQGVMNAPQAPLVVIAAATKTTTDEIRQRFKNVGKMWRSRTGGSGVVEGREVVFTWMDIERWGDWMKRMYNLKPSNKDDIRLVIADHKNLVYYDVDALGNPIKFASSSSIFSAIEDAASKKLVPKNSESKIERLARYLNKKMIGLEEYVVTNPLRSISFVLIFIGAVIWILLRLVMSETVVERGEYKAPTKTTRLD